jgi:Trk-type K+ transport system membrane component
MKLKSLKFFSLVVFVLASFISVSSHSTSVIAKTNKCPQINGIYQRKSVRIQVERKGRREGIANSQEWAEIASRKKAIAERA